MEVKLISYTQPSEELAGENIKDVQELIAFCARVSNPKNQYNSETSERLIKYLLRSKHFSPFELCNICISITTTRAMGRAILRHKSVSGFQEFSQRYANVAELGDMFILQEARLQDYKNRQNSFETDDEELKAEWLKKQNEIIEKTKEVYSWALEKGIAKEQARAILPEGLTKTKIYMNATVRTWIHYIELRSGHGTQKEHMEIARACAEAISKIFPMIKDFCHYDKESKIE